MSSNGDQAWGKPSPNAAEKARARMSYGAPYFKLEGGESGFRSNYLRILPPHRNMTFEGELNWYFPHPVHYNVGPTGAQRTIGCARLMKLGPCPVCEVAFGLTQEGLKEEASNFKATQNAYINVVKLTEPTDPEKKDLSTCKVADDRVHVLAVRSNIIDLLDEEFKEHGDLTDIEEGHNINLRRKGTKRNTEYRIKVSAPCPFPGDVGILDGIIDMTQVVEFLSYDKVNALLSGDTSGSDAFAKVEEVEVKRLPAAAPEEDDAEEEEDDEAIEVEAAVVEEDDEEEEEVEEPTPAPAAKAKKAPPSPADDEDDGPHPEGCRCADCKTTKANGNGDADPKAAEARENLMSILRKGQKAGAK